MKRINSIPVIIWEDISKVIDPGKNGVIITSPSAFKYSKASLGNLKEIEIILIQDSSYQYVNELVRKVDNNFEVAYLIGGGRVVDVGRYLANKWNLEAICIPTIISTDAFLVDCTGLRKKGCVTYTVSKKADRVILDWQLLKQAPWRFHVSGCSDVLSIFTGLFDWQYANEKNKAISDEKFNKSIAIMAKSILDGLISASDEIKLKSQKGLEAIVTALAMEVQLCNFYGNSRPEEGGEHFFTYCIENKMPHFFHGEMVAFGILLTGYLQGQDIIKIKNFMDKVGLNYKPLGLNRKVVAETLEELPSYVIKHKLRYSIYNEFSYQEEKQKIQKYLNSILN